jgi:hypothetical protein
VVFLFQFNTHFTRACRGRDRMVVRFTTTCAISTYICITIKVRIPFMAMCTRNNIMWSSLSVTWGRSDVSSTNKTDRNDIIEILLKVTFNTITLPQNFATTHVSIFVIHILFFSTQYCCLGDFVMVLDIYLLPWICESSLLINTNRCSCITTMFFSCILFF